MFIHAYTMLRWNIPCQGLAVPLTRSEWNETGSESAQVFGMLFRPSQSQVSGLRSPLATYFTVSSCWAHWKHGLTSHFCFCPCMDLKNKCIDIFVSEPDIEKYWGHTVGMDYTVQFNHHWAEIIFSRKGTGRSMWLVCMWSGWNCWLFSLLASRT